MKAYKKRSFLYVLAGIILLGVFIPSSLLFAVTAFVFTLLFDHLRASHWNDFLRPHWLVSHCPTHDIKLSKRLNTTKQFPLHEKYCPLCEDQESEAA